MKYLITDKGAGLPCSIGEFQGDGSFVPAANQVVIDKVDLPSGLPDCWKIENGELKSDELAVKSHTIKDIKKQRAADMNINSITITHNSKEWTFAFFDMIKFNMKIARNRIFKWKADDNTHVDLTIAVANDMADKIDDAVTKIFFDAETAISNLQA